MILVDQVLKAFVYDVSKELSVFVGLIITNCIIMGRLEAFGMANGPWESFLDGIGSSFGYAWILIVVAFFRELLGAGSLFGVKIIPQFVYYLGYVDMGLMLLAPGAFILIGLLVCVQNLITQKA